MRTQFLVIAVAVCLSSVLTGCEWLKKSAEPVKSDNDGKKKSSLREKNSGSSSTTTPPPADKKAPMVVTTSELSEKKLADTPPVTPKVETVETKSAASVPVGEKKAEIASHSPVVEAPKSEPTNSTPASSDS